MPTKMIKEDSYVEHSPYWEKKVKKAISLTFKECIDILKKSEYQLMRFLENETTWGKQKNGIRIGISEIRFMKSVIQNKIDKIN